MRRSFTSISILVFLVGLTIQTVSGQTFANGSFETGDFTNWQVDGAPVVVGAPPTPFDGSCQALINSTGSGGNVGQPSNFLPAASDTASNLQTFLGLASPLPGNSRGAAQNGQAILQTFSTTNGATISFSYRYQSREAVGNGYDETGYVLNGVFHVLGDTATPNQHTSNAVSFFTLGVTYQTVTITVGPGTTTLGFVAYNTGNTLSPTGLYIDNVVVTPLTGNIGATITLDSLYSTYDGSAKTVTATTIPANLSVTITYNGGSVLPTDAGDYFVNAVINDPTYQGSATAVYVVGKADSQISFANLSATYDGTPKSATATTTPSGLTVNYTYNGSSTPPSAVGTYPVTATIADPNYQASSVSDTFTITGTFADWENSYGISGAPTDMPFGDGVPNLLKYLYDIDPTRPMTSDDRAALPAFALTPVNGTTYLTLTYRKNRTAGDVQVQPQASNDLQSWSAIPGDQNFPKTLSSTADYDIIQVGIPLTNDKQFIRLQVTQ